jgi:hypothetical protein
MNGISAKVAQEIGVFFQNKDFHARSRQKEPEHHAGRSSSYYTATRLN